MSRRQVSITQKSARTLARVPFNAITKKVMGGGYELSLVVANRKLMTSLNRKFRGFNRSTDILSFRLSAHHGEIFINPEMVASKAKKFDLSTKKYLTYLFIHGLLHLKRHRHGVIMKREERKFCKKFRIEFPF